MRCPSLKHDTVRLAHQRYRFVVVDGTIVTRTGLIANGTAGPVADVHTMMGYMRDDGAAFIGYPVSFTLCCNRKVALIIVAEHHQPDSRTLDSGSTHKCCRRSAVSHTCRGECYVRCVQRHGQSDHGHRVPLPRPGNGVLRNTAQPLPKCMVLRIQQELPDARFRPELPCLRRSCQRRISIRRPFPGVLQVSLAAFRLRPGACIDELLPHK